MMINGREYTETTAAYRPNARWSCPVCRTSHKAREVPSSLRAAAGNDSAVCSTCYAKRSAPVAAQAPRQARHTYGDGFCPACGDEGCYAQRGGSAGDEAHRDALAEGI